MIIENISFDIQKQFNPRMMLAYAGQLHFDESLVNVIERGNLLSLSNLFIVESNDAFPNEINCMNRVK